MNSPRKLHRGFSAIEVLVVIVVITMCLALMTPKILQTAEAARRTQCRNNLAQIALALNNYEEVHKVLPPGTVNPTGPIENMPDGHHISWTVQLLPYLEQSSLYESIDPTVGVYGSTLTTTQLPVYSCSTTTGGDWGTAAKKPVVGGYFGAIPSAYAACYGDSETAIDNSNNGVFFLNSSIARHQIRDGCSNTIMIGEKNPSPGDLGWMSGTSSTLRNLNDSLNKPDDQVMEVGSVRNGGFGSGHPDAAIFAFGDGSVRILRNSIDQEVLRKLGNRHDGQLINKEF